MPNWLERNLFDPLARALLRSNSMSWEQRDYELARIEQIEGLRSYANGLQRETLKSKDGQNDNITLNFTGLSINRSVDMVTGGGITFEIDDPKQQEYINKMYDLNRSDVLFNTACEEASVSGTGYIQIVPDAYDDNGVSYPRLIVVDSSLVTLVHTPGDIDSIIRYEIRYRYAVGDDERVRCISYDANVNEDGFTASWNIIETEEDQYGHEISSKEKQWNYEFPPIVHWKNMPNIRSPYGRADIDDAGMSLQDKINFNAANISKIIKHHAHPLTVGKGVKRENMLNSPGNIVLIDSNSDIYNVEMQSDLTAAQENLNMLTRQFFSITRTVHLASIADKIGQVTNFGLRVLYRDALAKTTMKQRMMGEALEELNKYALILYGIKDPKPSVVIFADPLPEDDTEEQKSILEDLRAGLISEETARVSRKYDNNKEVERLANEAQVKNENQLTRGQMAIMDALRGDTGGIL